MAGVVADVIDVLFGLVIAAFCGWYIWRSLETGRAAWILHMLAVSRSEWPFLFWSRICLAAMNLFIGLYIMTIPLFQPNG
jgi:hypothetical protein